MVVSQAPLVEVAVTRRVRVLGSLEDMAVCAMAMNVGVGLGLAVGVDRKEAESCGSEEPKDVRREERGLGDPFVGDGGSARTYTPLAQFGLVVRCHEIRHHCVRRRSRTREHHRFRRCHAIVEQKRRASVVIEDGENAVNRSGTMESYLFDKIPGGLLYGSRQQSETGARCFGPSLLRVGHEARRRGRRQFENEGVVVGG